MTLTITNVAPTVTVTVPTAGTQWSGSTTINWTSTEPVDNPLEYVLSYSTDGTNYTQITTGTTSSGSDSYVWASTGIDSTTVSVQLLVADDDTTATGTSSVFTLDNT